MVLWEVEARLVANLECIAVSIIVTTLLAEINCYPILFYSSDRVRAIVNTLANLLGVVVDKLAPNSMIYWELVKVASIS